MMRWHCPKTDFETNKLAGRKAPEPEQPEDTIGAHAADVPTWTPRVLYLRAKSHEWAESGMVEVGIPFGSLSDRGFAVCRIMCSLLSNAPMLSILTPEVAD